MGPSAIRYAGLRGRLAELGYQVRDHGNIRVADRDESDEIEYSHGARQAHHSDEIVRLAEAVGRAHAWTPVTSSTPIPPSPLNKTKSHRPPPDARRCSLRHPHAPRQLLRR